MFCLTNRVANTSMMMRTVLLFSKSLSTATSVETVLTNGKLVAFIQSLGLTNESIQKKTESSVFLIFLIIE